MEHAAPFDWIADRVGVFPYLCKHHQPNMRATLRVTA
jgi:hypothetical protein